MYVMLLMLVEVAASVAVAAVCGCNPRNHGRWLAAGIAPQVRLRCPQSLLCA